MTTAVSTVQKLIAKQFPQYGTLAIKPFHIQGNDHHTFHLGKNLLIRMPSASGYALHVLREHTWLPFLKKHLLITIPHPRHLEEPSADFPWHFSITELIEGDSLDICKVRDDEKVELARDLAGFLKSLHKVPTHGAPSSSPHNYHRGGALKIYDQELREAVQKLNTIFNINDILRYWEKALQSTWDKNPVWVHGDLAPGNLLIEHGKLKAVIDFGCMAVGDPACDLAMAWTFFDTPSRTTFQEKMNLDQRTWQRAGGWALWKACIELTKPNSLSSLKTLKNRQIICAVLDWAQIS